jgi:hypothetical protein
MLTGCVTYGPTDLKLVALGKVNRATERQVPGFYEANGLYVRPNEPALKVVFSSRTDLLNYTKDNLSLVAHADFCNEKERPPDFTGQPWYGLAWIDVYSGEMDISRLHGDMMLNKTASPPSLPREVDGTIIYKMYVISFVKADRYKDRPHEQLYDLTTVPHEVCLHISSSGFMSRRDSNTMKIPANLLKAALQ